MIFKYVYQMLLSINLKGVHRTLIKQTCDNITFCDLSIFPWYEKKSSPPTTPEQVDGCRWLLLVHSDFIDSS